MIVSLSGKGGVGKTTVAALLLDEIARRGFSAGKILAVDGDPAQDVHALGRVRVTIHDGRVAHDERGVHAKRGVHEGGAEHG